MDLGRSATRELAEAVRLVTASFQAAVLAADIAMAAAAKNPATMMAGVIAHDKAVQAAMKVYDEGIRAAQLRFENQLLQITNDLAQGLDEPTIYQG